MADDKPIATFRDYFRNAYVRDAGLRIDHLLLSPSLAGRLVPAEVYSAARSWEKASDHAPTLIELAVVKKTNRREPEMIDVRPVRPGTLRHRSQRSMRGQPGCDIAPLLSASEVKAVGATLSTAWSDYYFPEVFETQFGARGFRADATRCNGFTTKYKMP